MNSIYNRITQLELPLCYTTTHSLGLANACNKAVHAHTHTHTAHSLRRGEVGRIELHTPVRQQDGTHPAHTDHLLTVNTAKVVNRLRFEGRVYVAVLVGHFVHGNALERTHAHTFSPSLGINLLRAR